MYTALMLIALTAPGAEAPPPPEVAQDDLGWRSIYRCGPNSLYVVLLMHGKQVDYDSLVEEFNLTDRGANVADLARVAQAHGIPYTPLRAKASALSKLPLPAIVHFQSPAYSKGHYVVLLSVNGDGIFTIIECTTGQMELLSRGDFLERWSGVVLVRSDRRGNKRLDNLLLVSSGVLLLLIPACLIRRRAVTTAPSVS